MLEVAAPDAVAAPVTQFFTPPQFAALRKLAGLIQPRMKASPARGAFGGGAVAGNQPPAAGQAEVLNLGALDCGVPEFLDFLIGVSPADRQQLYRNGLDSLNTLAKKQFNKSFADVDDAQAHIILTPLLVPVPWAYDPPKDSLKHFIFAVRQDIPTATRNSPEFAAAGANSGRRGGGGGGGWNPIDPVYRG